ncbi:gluconokinase [Ligilactobacillus pobuzihii]|uniref:Gluconokinase n=1 Tax=Ligilactobacillus pobuzihii TaxID=449659 RepID=A0A0R2LAG7_9LACO|nr:gluconokinase [Ligilactobacillus pobuzihii]KRK09358.1 gluconokinase [Ligilactobacillus pobuzihii E100301 = KCTC 13174]KRN98528.1 gluconokinase [Ligilactobacillus pobuzihii]GEN48555.1 gluconate kinase [Ligilactobacillus pobuzihii]
MNYIIGMDIGTTSTKAVLYGNDGKVYSHANEGYPLYRDATGMAEEDQNEILEAVTKALQQVVSHIDFKKDTLKGVSFSSANQSLIALDKDHQPLTRIQTWGDTRSTKYAEQIKNSDRGQAIYEKTGTPIHPMSLLCKIMWLKNEKPDIYEKAAYYCGIKEYVFYRLFGVWQMDISVASCTGLFNIFEQQWDQEAMEIAGVTAKQLPPVVNAYHQFSGLKEEIAKITGCPADTTFIQGAFDGALSNLGVGAIDNGVVAVTIGTSGAVRIVTDHPVTDPKGRIFCYAVDKDHYVVGGPVNNGGDVFRWARDNLFDSEKSTAALLHKNAYDLLTEIAGQVPAGSDGLLFHPYLSGERAPIWEANARGSFFGLTQMHTRAHMVRAVLEGIVYNLYTVLLALEEVAGQPKEILATGGFARSQLWRQMLADVFERPVTIPQDFESSCLGAAVIGMKSLGMANDFNVVKQFIGETSTYDPNPDNFDVYRELVPIYIRLTRQLRPEYENIARFQIKHSQAKTTD